MGKECRLHCGWAPAMGEHRQVAVQQDMSHVAEKVPMLIWVEELHQLMLKEDNIE
jgi:hypothetical protein